MKFEIGQAALKTELAFVAGVVERKNTIPVLSNILIESLGESRIRIIGTDLDTIIRCDVECKVIEPGSMCVQARKLFDIVRLIDGKSDLHFATADNDWVNLKAGKSKFKLAGVAKEQFPEQPAFTPTSMELPAEVFQHFIRHTSFAITTDQSRFTLSGAKLLVKDEKIAMIATDGHRLAYMERALENPEAFPALDVLVPKKALLELVKLVQNSESLVNFGEDQNHIFFQIDDRLLTARKLSGQFPNYEMVMPKDNDQIVIMDPDAIRFAILRVAQMADERNRSIRINLKTNELQITAQSAEEGEGEEVLEVEYGGEDVILGFNHDYLRDFLAVVGSSEDEEPVSTEEGKEKSAPMRIAMKFKDPNSQTEFGIHGDARYTFRYIVMPLRV